MPRGGKREGAGRKPGTVAGKQYAERIASADATSLKYLKPEICQDVMSLSPIDVMYLAMRVSVQEGDLKTAAFHATNVAPYVHSKMPAHTIINAETADIRALTTEELMATAAKLNLIEAQFESDNDERNS